MTTWADAKRFVHQNYKAEDVSDGLLKLLFNTGNLRSQVVFIVHEVANSGEEWIRVNSPIGSLDRVDVVRAARLLNEKIVGGLIVMDDIVVVTNSVPLQNLDANELTQPLERVMSIADDLEAQLVGQDVF